MLNILKSVKFFVKPVSSTILQSVLKVRNYPPRRPCPIDAEKIVYKPIVTKAHKPVNQTRIF